MKFCNFLWVWEPHQKFTNIMFYCYPFPVPVKHQVKVFFQRSSCNITFQYLYQS
uniref:Uncharacterized protein n=1 Tax=Arundo donax TaxID=35708 RepID=A0A0A9C5I2_ARUDO